ncbi:MAG: heavy metal translocating P-type ATPase [Trebonia sp.]
MSETGTFAASGQVEAELVVTGMTCGSCAARIERRLNRLDGVAATVNYATGRAYFTSVGGREAAELIGVINSTGYQAALPAPPQEAGPASDPQVRDLGRRLAVCGPLAVAVIVLSMVSALQFTGWQWVSLLLTAPVAVWGAWPLHRAALAGLGQGAATMDTLVSLAVTASSGWSLYALFFGGAGAAGMRMPFAFTFSAASGMTLYLDAAAGVTTAVLAGRYLEARARDRSASALTALAALGAKSVAVLRDGAEHRVPVGELAAGELFVVRPGEKIAADGIVVEGSSAVDSSLVTGESMPVEVGAGSQVTGATVNMSGRLVVRADRVGADTLLAQITRLVTHAQATKASAQRLADRIAAVFVPCVIALAVTTLGFWLGAGLTAAAAWSAAVAVLVVACPCALGLATPTALVAAVGRGAELGILVKSARSLESARRITTIVLDKTGTLTTGIMAVTDVITSPHADAGEAAQLVALLLAGAVEDGSEHPIGQAIARAAAARFGGLPEVTGFTALPGAGVRGRVGDRDVIVGSPELFAEVLIEVPAALRDAVSTAAGEGRTAVLVGWDGQARAALTVTDELRPGAGAAVARLRALGLRPMLLTGDNEHVADAVAGQVGIASADVLAGIRPDGKAAVIRNLRENGHPAVFVGDGVNDAAALAQAELGMAIGSGTDVAIGAADLTLVGTGPDGAVEAIELARATMTVIWANLGWAFCYNVIALPLAAFGYLNPLFAGIAMSASSLIVVANSLRLRRFTPGGRLPRAWRIRPAWRARSDSSAAGGSRRGTVAPGWLVELVRAAAGPVICAVVLIGLLTVWAGTRGAGTLTKVRIQVTMAAVPMRAFTPQAADAVGTAQAYLVIRNLSPVPDELVAARTPIAGQVIFVQGGLGGQQTQVAGLAVPAGGTLSLSPLTGGLLIEHPAPFENRRTVPLTLVFRHAGQITVDATVTAPFTP